MIMSVTVVSFPSKIRQYTLTSILDPSNLSQTPILESFIKRPTIYYIETVKFRLFKEFLNPYFILAFFSYFEV